MHFLRRVWQIAVRIDREALIYARPLRAAVVSLIGLGLLIGHHDVRSALPFGVGVLFAAMADRGGPLRQRVVPMIGTSIAITIGTGLGGIVSSGTWAHILLGGVVALVCGFAGAIGVRWMAGGVLTLVVYTIFGGAPITLLASGLDAMWMAIGCTTLILSMLVAHAAARLVGRGVAPLPASEVEHPPSVWSRAREHLHWNDQFVLHAIRLSLVIMLAITLEEELTFPHSYWIPMTVAWITRPDLDGTVERVVLRVVGTLVGIAFAGTFLVTIHPGTPLSVLMVSFAVFLVLSFLVPNYAIAVVGITIFVFFLFSIVGYPTEQMIVTRIFSTLLAAVLVAIAIHVGPRGEPAPSTGPELAQPAAPPPLH